MRRRIDTKRKRKRKGVGLPPRVTPPRPRAPRPHAPPAPLFSHSYLFMNSAWSHLTEGSSALSYDTITPQFDFP